MPSIKLFTEGEAWGLFKLAAFSEATGWSLLIAGLLIRHFNLPGHAFAVLIAGQIHGMCFLAYFLVVITAYSSLGWSRKKFLLAVLAGVPPFGSLVFEQWAAYSRRAESSRLHFNTITLALLRDRLAGA